jgi:hypothetical protein
MFHLPRLRVALFALVAFAAAGCPMAQDSSSCCPDKPPIRPIDKTCLPAGRSKPVPLFRGDLLVKYQEVANIDSFLSDDNCSDTAKLQLKDLQAKGCAIGADALIRVRLLTNNVRGFQVNPDTPFWSLKQGAANDYFYRATAIKYLEPVSGEPEAVTVQNIVPAQPGKGKAKGDAFGTDKLFRKKKGQQQKATVPEALSTNPRSY